ncbi:hypothetical protein MLD38_019605 [Melastoma candidum]|uniref:Uncharacterized protein n=1 Tax=Melastoma candidum TaxID=119954 RepID=A0ACB9QY38_9MYRT|nr:hypothetical protein MLD38_019605 [Melastoma candidum]
MQSSSSSSPLSKTHVKLLAFDLQSLVQTATSPPMFARDCVPLSWVEVLGTVTFYDNKPDRFLKFAVDDGTGCVPCILWLNHLRSPIFSCNGRREPRDVQLIAHVAANHASKVRIGAVARVRGMITSFRGAMQVTVSDVVIETDPNTEILHWLDCIRLARRVYDRASGAT